MTYKNEPIASTIVLSVINLEIKICWKVYFIKFSNSFYFKAKTVFGTILKLNTC